MPMMTKRWFITGISGLLGLNMALQLRERHQIRGCYYSHPVASDGVTAMKLDLTSSGVADTALRLNQPDVLIHTVSLTSVEGCEADPEGAYRVNVESAYCTAKVASALGARLVYISTDQLFEGSDPWKREEDVPHPLNVYAMSKLQAEEVVFRACPDALVIRTNFFGWGTSVRTSFSDWILRSLEERRDLTMFYDVLFTPILINDLVELILGLVDREASGIFHVAGAERLSKYDFALKVAEAFDYPEDKILATSVHDFPFSARRPNDMSLSSRKAEDYLGIQMPMVEDGLRRLKEQEVDGHRAALEEAIQVGLPFR